MEQVEHIPSIWNGGEKKIKAFCEGKTIAVWDNDILTFTDGSRLEVERDDFYGDEFKLITTS